MENRPQCKGFIVFRVNVGRLDAAKADAYIIKCKDNLRSGRPELECWETVWIPTRTGRTTVKFYVLDEKCNLTKLQAKDITSCLIDNSLTFEFPMRDVVNDYVLVMLGAPVVKIELNEQQLDACYDNVKSIFEELIKVKGSSCVASVGPRAFQEMILAKAKVILGMIRRKYHNGSNDSLNLPSLDGQELVNEGTQELHYWNEILNNL